MDKNVVFELMKSKVKLGWAFEKIYDHLISIDDYQKINKQVALSTSYTTKSSDEKS